MHISLSLPGSLDDSRDLALQRQFPEAQTADIEIAVVGPGSAAQSAAVVPADREFLILLGFCY
jgi:hypothetical protein